MLLNKDFEVPKEEHAKATFEKNLDLHRLITYLFNSCFVCRSSLIFTKHLRLFQNFLTVNAHTNFTWRHLPRGKICSSHNKRGIWIIHTNLVDWYLELDFDFT